MTLIRRTSDVDNVVDEDKIDLEITIIGRDVKSLDGIGFNDIIF